MKFFHVILLTFLFSGFVFGSGNLQPMDGHGRVFDRKCSALAGAGIQHGEFARELARFTFAGIPALDCEPGFGIDGEAFGYREGALFDVKRVARL